VTVLGLAVAGVVSAAVVLPHLIPLNRATPAVGIAVWMLVLALRAASAVALATLALVGLADVPIVHAALAWCWHTVLPDVPRAIGFDEHPVSHAVVAAPTVAVAGSLFWLTVRVVRGAIALHRLLGRTLGTGPQGSTVIQDERVVLGVTGFGRGRVLVSDRALGELDAEELAAGLMHEHAHLRRLHRPVLVAAVLLGAIGRLLPGTRAAERELRFQLERDADHYTVRALQDPLALASAICKAAGAAPTGVVAGLSGHGRVTQRLEELLDGEGPRRPGVERAAWALMALLGCLVVVLVATAPAWGLAELGQASAQGEHHCHHNI
jgi:hypothetical protein